MKSQSWSQPSRHAAATKDVGGSETVALQASSVFESQANESGKRGEGKRESGLRNSYAVFSMAEFRVPGEGSVV